MKKTLLAATTALAITLTAGVASAQEEKPLDLIDSNNVREQKAYEYEFNRDEQCQGYMLGVKRLGITDSCAKDEEEELIVVPQNEQQELLNEYVVYFDFDKAAPKNIDYVCR